jgi:hypothetical protein
MQKIELEKWELSKFVIPAGDDLRKLSRCLDLILVSTEFHAEDLETINQTLASLENTLDDFLDYFSQKAIKATRGYV